MTAERHLGKRAIVLALVLLLPAVSCSIRKMAVNTLADSLASGADVFLTDDDPELIRDAMPFALKTIEALIEEAPDNRGLLVAACRGFAGYAYFFVQTDADLLEYDDYRAARAGRERALRLYLRARDYEKHDATHARFTVEVPPRSTRTVAYTVRTYHGIREGVVR